MLYIHVLTLSTKHSVPENINPTIAKFFPYDRDLDFMSLRMALADWSATPVMGLGMDESIPAVKSPKTKPRPYPKKKINKQCTL